LLLLLLFLLLLLLLLLLMLVFSLFQMAIRLQQVIQQQGQIVIEKNAFTPCGRHFMWVTMKETVDPFVFAQPFGLAKLAAFLSQARKKLKQSRSAKVKPMILASVMPSGNFLVVGITGQARPGEQVTMLLLLVLVMLVVVMLLALLVLLLVLLVLLLTFSRGEQLYNEFGPKMRRAAEATSAEYKMDGFDQAIIEVKAEHLGRLYNHLSME